MESFGRIFPGSNLEMGTVHVMDVQDVQGIQGVVWRS